MQTNNCTIEVYKVADDWTWQIETEAGEAITPRRRVFRSPLSAKRAATTAADRLRLTITGITNLEGGQ